MTPTPESRPPDRKQLRRLSEAEIDEMEAAYLSGKSVYDLAPVFGIHRTTVGIILGRRGTSMRRKGIPESCWREIVRLRNEEGWAWEAIAKRYEVSATAVHTVVRKMKTLGA